MTLRPTWRPWCRDRLSALGRALGSAWLRRLAPVVLFAVFMFFRGEWYPFSNFPMYARLEGDRWIVELCDEHGQVIPALSVVGLPTANLKKIVDKNLLALKKDYPGTPKAELPIEAWHKAGHRALDYAAERFATTRPGQSAGPWQLWRRTFTYDEAGRVISLRIQLASWPPVVPSDSAP